MAVREYHYLTEQVIAIKGNKPFTGTQTRFARFYREKVMAYLFQRLTVCQRYWITLFSFQRTGKEENFLFTPYQDSKSQFVTFFRKI